MRFKPLTVALVAALIAVAGVVATPSPALAETPSGTFNINIGGSSGRVAWAGWDAYDNHMWADVHLTTTLSSGYCADSWYDWPTPEGKSHYDARGSRTCVSSHTIYGPVVYEQYDMSNGLQKGGGAYGPGDATKYTITNDTRASISINTITALWGNYSVKMWRYTSSGGLQEWSGGSPISFNS